MLLRHALTRPLCALALGGVLVLPAAASGAGGGASPGAAPQSPPAGADGGATPLGATTPAAGEVTLAAPSAAFVGEGVRFRGRSAAGTGTTITLQRLGSDGAWVSVARGATSAAGTFGVTWRSDHVGRLRLRAVPTGTASSARTAGASPVVWVTVYRPARATYFGPGLYGRRTACGARIGPMTLGVAHRTLACGTRVALRFRGRSITVPVIDRGPFAPATEWDLTAATADRIGMTGTSRIGVLTLGIAG